MEFVTEDEVEVRSSSEEEEEKGFFFYLPASVVRSIPNQRRYTVSYSSSSSSSSSSSTLRETVDATRLRPRPPPPPPASSPGFCLHDCVDAFRDGAWWPGVLVGLPSHSGSGSSSRSSRVSVSVCFPLRRKVVPFASSHVRPHLEWLSARWVPPHLLEMPPSLFDKGATVEVAQFKVTDGSPSPVLSAWFPATVTKRIWHNNYLVHYSHFATPTSSPSKPEPVQEIVHLRHLRPRPCRASAVSFCVNDPVEAFHGSGWHPGTVLQVFHRPVPIYAVRLPHLNNKDMNFDQLHLRPRFDWLHGRWLPSSQRDPDAKMKFTNGMLVEVSSDEDGFKGAWFGATIGGPVGSSFCVEYHNLRTDDETALLQETIDPSHIRPVPPETRCGPNPLRLLEEVDAYYNDGWWAGLVSKVVEKNRYVVYFRQWNEETEFEHDELRPHYDWVGGRWVRSSLALEL